MFLSSYWRTSCSFIPYFNTVFRHSPTQSMHSPGLTLEGNSGKEVALWRLTSPSRWSKAKYKSPCNFEESPAYFPYVSFMKMSISCLLKYIVSVLKVIFLKSNPLRFKETLISFNNKQQCRHWKGDAIWHCATGNVDRTFNKQTFD